MAHQRRRFLMDLILKRRKLWPIYGVTGPRQVGKSTLFRDELRTYLKATYLTLDRNETKVQAEKAPDFFLERHEATQNHPLIIDEVQKVPPLFDSLKLSVDENRIPGRYFITGSTQFSEKAGIRESLTGRIGINRLYPLNSREIFQREMKTPWITLKPTNDLLSEKPFIWLEKGGMPGFCFIRNRDELEPTIENWIETTCERDLLKLKMGKLNSSLAKEIIQVLPKLEKPTAFDLRNVIGTDTRIIQKHLEALETLFVLHRVDAHPSGIGKAQYYLFDAAVSFIKEGSLFNRLKIWVLNECLSQYEYSGKVLPQIRYYQSPKHSVVDLIIEHKEIGQVGVLFSDAQSVHSYFLRRARSFLDKFPKAQVFILCPVKECYELEPKIRMIPWSGMI